eukprot:1975541-Prymnesium_polylepis.1
MPWRSSKASPLASAHEMRWPGGSCGTCARAGAPAEPACRAAYCTAYTPAASPARSVGDAVRWKP